MNGFCEVYLLINFKYIFLQKIIILKSIALSNIYKFNWNIDKIN